MGSFLHHLRSIGKNESVCLVDVTERWNDGRHGYWAFTDPSWHRWAISGVGEPPRSLVRATAERPAADV